MRQTKSFLITVWWWRRKRRKMLSVGSVLHAATKTPKCRCIWKCMAAHGTHSASHRAAAHHGCTRHIGVMWPGRRHRATKTFRYFTKPSRPSGFVYLRQTSAWYTMVAMIAILSSTNYQQWTEKECTVSITVSMAASHMLVCGDELDPNDKQWLECHMCRAYCNYISYDVSVFAIASTEPHRCQSCYSPSSLFLQLQT